MDIPVSRLNERMAVQVPAQLPLGLVFVVGKVENLAMIDEDGLPHEFFLLESNHRLRCRLTDRAAHEVGFKDGDLVRAGGHLAFEPQHADYFLLARDVEILGEVAPSRSTLAEIVAESKQQPQIAGLAAAELPTWVKQMAPPEIQEELLTAAVLSDPASEITAGDSWEALEDAEASLANPAEEPALAGLSDDLIDFLSEAMDSSEDVEVTPQLITAYKQQNSSGAAPVDVVLAGGVAAEMAGAPEPSAEEFPAVITDDDDRLAVAAGEDVVEPSADTRPADVVVDEWTADFPEEARSAGRVPKDSPVEDQVTGEAAESASPVGRPARRRRRRKQRDKVPWLLVVVALFLFLIFLGIIAVGLGYV